MHAPPAFLQQTLASAPRHKHLTLAIVNQNGKVLLGYKKRGFGQGYYNGFGGKVEAGETVEAAASRELLEEACITADSLHELGLLTFVFDDNPVPWQVHVYDIAQFSGEPTETEEMRPVWFEHTAIPYDTMWADDSYWYPLFLQRKYFRGIFAFENTTSLVWHRLEECTSDLVQCPLDP